MKHSIALLRFTGIGGDEYLLQYTDQIREKSSAKRVEMIP